MPSQIRKRERLPERAERVTQTKHPAPNGKIPPVLSLPTAAGRRSEHPRPDHEPLSAGETVTTRVEPEEVLIADVRGHVTPAQMVERRLMALLRNSGSGDSL